MGLTAIPSRSPGLVSRQVEGQFVVLDEATGQVHLLEGAVAQVWAAADGGLGPDVVTADLRAAVAQLVDLGLLVEAPGMTRRTLLRSTTIAAGVGITSMALPMAAAHASSNVPTSLVVTAGTLNPTPGSSVTLTAKLTRTNTGEAVQGAVITFSSGATTLGTATTDSTGTAVFAVTAPAGGGQYAVTASTPTTGAYAATYQSASQSITLFVAKLTPSKTAFTRNGGSTTLTISGVGFASNSTVSFTNIAGGTARTISPTSVTTGSDGSFAATTFTVSYPNGSGGGTITGTDAAGNKASFNYTS